MLINHLCFPGSLLDVLPYIVLLVNMTQDLSENYSDMTAILDITLFYIKQVHKCINTVKEMLQKDQLKVTQSQLPVKSIR